MIEWVSTVKEVYFGKPGVVLVLFFFTCFLAQGNSELFSINPAVFEEEYGLSDTDIRLFLDYAAFAYILFAWPFMELFTRNQDLRTWVVRFISCIAFGSILRMVPLWLNERMVWLFHISQMIIPLGIFATALPAQIAVVWFPVKHRGFTTAVITIAGVLGPSVFRTVGAEITTNTSQAQEMFYVEGLMALIIFSLIVTYLPKQPEDIGLAFEDNPGGSQNPKGWLQNLMERDKIQVVWAKGVIPVIVAVSVALGLKASVFSNMTSLLEEDDVDNTEAAWISSCQGYTQIFGAAALGYAMSYRSIRAQRRKLMIGCFFVYGILTTLFSFSFSSVFWSAAPFPYYFWLSMTIEGIAGCFWGCMRPLAFEYIAELSYPTPPGYFGAWILFAYNAVKAVSLMIPSSIASEFIFVIVAAASFFGSFLIWMSTPVRKQNEVYEFDEDAGYGASVYLSKHASVVENDSLYVINKRTDGPSIEYVVKV